MRAYIVTSSLHQQPRITHLGLLPATLVMMRSSHWSAYINYAKFEELTERDVIYVTKMKKSLKYEVLASCMDMNPDGLMEYHEQVVVFRKDGIAISPVSSHM